MEFREAVRFLYSLGNELKTAKFGLERITVLLGALGNPHRTGRFVHVAGTNGKGSVCAMLESALRAAGLRTGLYTSPHLNSAVERIQLNGVPVSEERFAAAFTEVHACAERLIAAGALDLHPTYFETVTAMAFVIFAESAEITVLETGLGGRLDATNVVTPDLAVITAIDFDHEAFLGSTIEAIAGEKAGILKAGVPSVFSQQRPEALRVLQAAAGRYRQTSEWPIADLTVTRWGSVFQAGGIEIECPLAGRHQVENARTAAMALSELRVPRWAIERGIAGARWPGRLERIGTQPDVIVDGAHNPAGARALAAYVSEFFHGANTCLIYGTMRDKAVGEVVDVLFPRFRHVIVTAPNQERALSPEVVVAMTDHDSLCAAENLRSAIQGVPADVTSIFVSGSLFLVGEAKAYFV